MSKLILVTGATGYIASRLIPRLLDSGYRVRCLARDPLRLAGRSWFRHVEIFQADVNSPATLPDAMKGVHTAYYLIHNMSAGHGYIERELQSAHNFANAAQQAGLEHIIYLGGLADPQQKIAPHMRSRIETGEILRRGSVPVTEFRAGVITGSGSISFEMIRFMTELFPVIPGPLWMKNRSQPIAIQNVIDYLMAALETSAGHDGVFEIGGPDVTTYAELMLRYGNIRGLTRRTILIPGIPVWFMAIGVGWMTPVPRPIASALIAGLASDSMVLHNEALKVFKNIQLIGLDDAICDALGQTKPALIERTWMDGQLNPKSIKHEGFFIDYTHVDIKSRIDRVFQSLKSIPTQSNWQTEVDEENKRIILHRMNFRAGDHWIEWKVDQNGEFTHVHQTVFFSPFGLHGFLYWFLHMPFLKINFRKLKRILWVN
jgi:uncharacterized protein YbjT (DUF2867 family)